MFPFANQALATDNDLGAAVINAGLPVNGVPLTTEEGDALYQKIYSQFAPNVTGASRALAVALTDQATGPVAERQRELRMYAAQPGDLTIWGQEFAVSLNQDANAGTIGYRDSGFGFAVGADGGDPVDGRYGGALTFYSGDIAEKQPRTSKTSSQWWLFTLYSDWRGRGFFLDTQLDAGLGQLDGKRLLLLQIPQPDGTLQNFGRTSEGKRNALLGAGGATTGFIFTTGSTVITPMLSIDGLAMREDGYHETGGGPGFGLDVQPTYYQSLRAFLGTDLRQDINLGDFYLQPEARVGYRYDFLSNPEKVKAAFEGTGVPFSLTGPDPTQGTAVAGASISATTGAWSVGLNYNYLRGTDGSISQEGTLSLVGRI
jgi:outer membrane autotransporter protein